MIEFEHKGIRVNVKAMMTQDDYKDARGNHKTRFEKNVVVAVTFWDFIIDNGDFQGLAFIDSIIQYYKQCHSKRPGMDGLKIAFAKELHRTRELYGVQSLCFADCQKAKGYPMHISFYSGGKMIDEVILDLQEVMMIEIAIGKAISMSRPV